MEKTPPADDCGLPGALCIRGWRKRSLPLRDILVSGAGEMKGGEIIVERFGAADEPDGAILVE